MKRLMVTAALLCGAVYSPHATRGEDIVYYVPNARGNIMDWLISSDHPVRYDFIGASMQQDALETTGGEKAVTPQAGMKAGLGTPWEERHYEPKGWAQGVFEFRPHPYYFTYAFVYLVCDRDLNELTLCTGSDDALLVLLNGQEVQRVQTQRGYAPDQEKTSIALRKGWNRLLCKVDDISGGHGLYVRLLGPDAQPFVDYKVCLVPPKDPRGPLNFVDGKVYEDEAGRLLKEAIRVSTEGRLDAAVEQCRQVAGRYPKSNAAAQALYQAAGYQKQQQHDAAAVALLDELLAHYPYDKWAEDALLAKADWLYPAGNNPSQAAKALEQLIDEHANSLLVPESMLKLAAIRAAGDKLDESDALLRDARTRFPNTVESVQSLEMLADNSRARKDVPQARQLWQQTIDEAGSLAAGKYVWFVNVQAMLHKIADRARAKMEGKSKTP